MFRRQKRSRSFPVPPVPGRQVGCVPSLVTLDRCIVISTACSVHRPSRTAAGFRVHYGADAEDGRDIPMGL